MSGSTGFFNMLFEFSFSRFIGIKIVGVLYGIGIFFIGLFCLLFAISGFKNDFLSGVGTLALSPLVFLLQVIMLRVSLEGFVATLRTAENTTQIAQNTKPNP
jgi:Domain of unknown function (DUF4282)